MNFQTKKIKKDKPEKKRKKINVKLNFGLVGVLLVVFLLFFGIAKAVSSINFSVFLTVAGEKLQTDENGNSNFMILGMGGEDHEGADLTDSMIVVSINHDNNSVSMLSIPRDMYVQDEKIGNFRINRVYPAAQNHYGNTFEAAEHTKSVLENLLAIEIHYWTTINFKAFVEIIDALGGIEVLVERAIYDPYYPKDGTYLYEPFSIGAGIQHMDGETALKYARSRQTTSDFDRSARQQDIIYAAKEKALQTRILFSRDRISDILKSLQNNIQTNISIREILTLGGIAENYSKENTFQYLIHDNPVTCGGFLYPPNRDLFGGMFVLLPAGGPQFIEKYAEMIFFNQYVSAENMRIHLLNGTTRGGAASETRSILGRFCFSIPRFGNAISQNVQQTTYYYRENSRPQSLDFLQTLIPGKESTEIPQEYLNLGYLNDTDVLLELGADYTGSDLYIKDPFASMWRIQRPDPEETSEPEENDENQ